jgi:hypothetical protein
MTEQPHHEEGEILKASGPGAGQIKVGMEVTSLDGQRIGRVKEVAAAEFLVDRPLARDVWVPFGAVLATQATSVVLNVSAAHVNAQGWRHA